MKKIISLFLLISLYDCQAQENKKVTNNSKNEKMERFDQRRFDENKIDGYCNFILQDGTTVRQWETPPDYYVEQSKKPDSHFEVYKEFHYSTKFIKLKGEQFYGFPIGIWREYNNNGILIKETDEDKPFRFSIEDLSLKMKERGVDIMKIQSDVVVSRSINPAPHYNISYPLSDGNHDDLNIIIIDGITGEIINETIISKEN